MRVLNFNDGFSSNSEPSLGTISVNNLFQFSNDAEYVAYKTIAASRGDIYFNTTSNKVRFHNGTSWVDTATTDELASKEDTIATGATGEYYRGDKTWQTLDKSAVGLSSVDNTSDSDKPISTATQSALDLKAPLESPTFTGTVSIPNLVCSGTTGAVKLHNLTTAEKNVLVATDGMVVYDTDLAKFQGYKSGAWSEIGGGNRLSWSDLTLTASDTIAISLTAFDESWLVQGGSGPVTLSTTPFGILDPQNGYRITLIGNSDANTVTIPTNDAANGVIGYSVTLGRGQTVTYEYQSVLDRYVIIGVSN